MIHAIIYANRGGYGLFESTENFPSSFKEPITGLCGMFIAGDTPCEPALRYAPLDGSYLLTVIFRQLQGNRDEPRKHIIAVNFLMEQSDADKFFDIPFTVAAQQAIRTATTLLQNYRDTTLPAEVCGTLIPSAPRSDQTPAGKVPLSLLTGVYHFLPKKYNAGVFIQSDQPAEEGLETLIGFLPPPLRKQLSFHTDCRDPSESREIAICFTRSSACTPPASSKAFSGFGNAYYVSFGSEEQITTERMRKLPDKLPLYPLLKHCITTWDQYFRLCQLLDSEKAVLKEALKILPDKDVLQAIMNNPPSEDTLRQLLAASHPKSGIYKEASQRLHLPEKKSPGILPDIFLLALTALLTAFCLWMQFRTQESIWALPCSITGISTGYYLRGLISRLVRKK